MALFVRYAPIILGGGGGSGSLTMGAFGSTPNANGGTISGGILTLQPADGTHPGGVSITTQTFAGNKTFTGTVISPLLGSHEIQDFTAVLAIDLDNRQLTDNIGKIALDWQARHLTDTVESNQLSWSTTGLNVPSLTGSRLVATDSSKNLISQATGNLTDVGTDGITVTNGTGAVIGTGTSIAQQVADATHNGYLSSTDWNTFNGKQPAGTYVTAVSVASANGFAGSSSGGATPALTLSTSITGVLKGNGTAISAQATTDLTDVGTDGITITNGTGAVLGASAVTIAQHVADTTHNGYLSSTDWNTFNGKQASGNYITALTSDVTASGPGSVAATIAANVVTNAKLAQMATLTIKGNNTGGTANALDLTVAQVNTMLGTLSNPMTTLGDIIYENASPAPTRLAGNTTSTKQYLSQTGNGSISAAPVWSQPAFSELSGTASSSQVTTSTFTAMTRQTLTSTGTTTGWLFTISTSSTVAVNDTYTNNANTYTVLAALTAQTGQVLFMSGASAPQASGTLTRSAGAGTSSISFTAAVALATYTTPTSPRGPLYLKLRMVGGGSGGNGSGTGSNGAGAAGTTTTFGSFLLLAGGGQTSSNQTGSNGGTNTANTSGTVVQIHQVPGSTGGTALNSNQAITINLSGGNGGTSPFGGAGGGSSNATGGAAQANSGSGGGGAGTPATSNTWTGGGGGGSGGYIEAFITSPNATYVYAVGTGGAGGSAGTGGNAGGNGGSGVIIVEECYQ